MSELAGRKKQIGRYYVVMATPWYVRNVSTTADACNIAVAEVGKRVPSYVDVDVGSVVCGCCGCKQKAVLLVADDALVGVVLGLKVYADSEEGAVRVAKSVLGKCLTTNLRLVKVEEL